MNTAAGFDHLEALDELASLAVAELAVLRVALTRLRHGSVAALDLSAPFIDTEYVNAVADQSAHRLCRSVADIAIHAAGLAELAGVRFYVGRELPRLDMDPTVRLPGLSLAVALAALLDARAAGVADADLFTCLSNGEDA